MTKLDEYPVGENTTVLDAEDIYKTDKWWKAVLTVEKNFNGKISKSVRIYQWVWNDRKGGWKNRGLYSVLKQEDWKKEKEAIENQVKKNLKVK